MQKTRKTLMFPLLDLFWSRKKSIPVPHTVASGKGRGPALAIAASLSVNLESLGYRLSPRALLVLSWMDKDALCTLGMELLDVVRKSLGTHVKYRPMYPNFPTQVMEASDLELWLRAQIHYLGVLFGEVILPETKEDPRTKVQNTRPYQEIHVMEGDPVFTLVQQMVTSQAGPSENDIKDLRTILTEVPDEWMRIQAIMVPNREWLAVLGAEWIQRGHDPQAFAFQWNSMTDFLRLAVAISGQDVSLAEPAKFTSFPRQMRRKFLEMANVFLEQRTEIQTIQDMESVFLRRERFLRLGERLHVQEYRDRYPLIAGVFKDLVENRKFSNGYNAVLERALSSRDFQTASNLLRQRPGVLARRWVHWMSTLPMGFQQEGVALLRSVAPHVSSSVLLQLHAKLKTLGISEAERVFSPKGQVAKLWTTPQFSKSGSEWILDSKTVEDAISSIEGELVSRWSALPSLGKVFIDPSVAGLAIPFGQRSASKSLMSAARGSRLAMNLEGHEGFRFFMWWNESKTVNGRRESVGRVDLDLSCVLMNEDFRVLRWCSWTDLRSTGMTHSGDITSAPNGACEFIDVDLKKLEPGCRYILMVVNSFTDIPFDQIPESFAGWMVRDLSKRKEKLMAAPTVEQKFDLSAQSSAVIPMFFDTHKQEVVWCDMPLPPGGIWRMVEGQKERLGWLVRGLSQWQRPQLQDLWALHVAARGERVEDPKDADICVMGLNPPEVLLSEQQKVVRATDIEYTMSELLSDRKE